MVASNRKRVLGTSSDATCARILHQHIASINQHHSKSGYTKANDNGSQNQCLGQRVHKQTDLIQITSKCGFVQDGGRASFEPSVAKEQQVDAIG